MVVDHLADEKNSLLFSRERGVFFKRHLKPFNPCKYLHILATYG